MPLYSEKHISEQNKYLPDLTVWIICVFYCESQIKQSIHSIFPPLIDLGMCETWVVNIHV